MGSWGSGTFENDDACEFESRLVTQGSKAIDTALASSTLGDLSDESGCAAALAAAEVIAAARGHAMQRFRETAADAAAWLAESGYRPSQRILARATKMAEAILADSGLANLWQESGESAAWKRSVRGLVKRLAKPAKPRLTPKPVRSTATSAPEKRAATSPNRPTKLPAAVAVPPISQRTAKQLLIKKTDGMLEEYRRTKGVDVSLRVLDKLTLADARALSTLADVRQVSLGGMKLAAAKRTTLGILLDGWTKATAIEAGATTGVAAMLCERMPRFAQLQTLDLSESDVTDGDLRQLIAHPTLEDLSVSSTRLTDAVFEIARGIPKLETLVLHDCPAVTIPAAACFAIADGSACRLRYSPHASRLGIVPLSPARREACAKRNNPVKQLTQGKWNVWVSLVYGHVYFGELPDRDRLEFMAKQCLVDAVDIGINNSAVRNETADRLRFVLAAWPQIRMLSIENSKAFDDSMAAELGRLQHLESLVIRNASIGDATAAAIATLTRLRQLCLVGTRISAKALPRLGRLPALRWLELAPSNGLSQEAILTLRRKLRDRCFVDCFGQ